MRVCEQPDMFGDRPYKKPEVIGIIKLARSQGYLYEEIAAYWPINIGRISEIMTGRRGANVPPATSLPADFPPRRR